MKRSHVFVLSVASGIMAVSSILATSVASAKIEPPASCTTIVSQCEAAGYMPGDHKKTGKGLWMDCVKEVGHGKTVAGVTVSAADAQKCGADMKAARPAKK